MFSSTDSLGVKIKSRVYFGFFFITSMLFLQLLQKLADCVIADWTLLVRNDIHTGGRGWYDGQFALHGKRSFIRNDEVHMGP